MKKEPIKSPAEIKSISNSHYVLLSGEVVARLLKPTVKNNKKYYNLRIKGEIAQYSVEELTQLAK